MGRGKEGSRKKKKRRTSSCVPEVPECYVCVRVCVSQVWLIDVSQSVEPTHPHGLEFLFRDCRNVSTVNRPT